MKWILSANGNMYDHSMAFQKWGFIDWSQKNRNYNIGDIIYIYCARPYQKIMYKTKVVKNNLSVNEIVDDREFWFDITEYINGQKGRYARLKLVEQVDNSNLSLESLKQHGLNAAPQGSIHCSEDLSNYIEKYMNDNYYENVFPDSAETKECVEGARVNVYVNKYERSSIARQRCIDIKGCYCHICGISFENVYGEVGKDFIHVHHTIPLNEINKEYIVDYKKDLIPVCPNCHAMLHRKINGKYLSVDELRNILNP